MDVQIATLCDSAADYRGKLCILGTFDTIVTSRMPATHPHCSIALRLVFRDTDQGNHKLKVALIDEDGANMLPDIEPELDVKIPDNAFFYSRNFIFNLQQIKFDKTGQYSIDIYMDGGIVARIPLQVMLAKGQQNS